MQHETSNRRELFTQRHSSSCQDIWTPSNTSVRTSNLALSRPVLGSTQSPIQWSIRRGYEGSGTWSWPPPTTVQITKEWSYNSTTAHDFVVREGQFYLCQWLSSPVNLPATYILLKNQPLYILRWSQKCDPAVYLVFPTTSLSVYFCLCGVSSSSKGSSRLRLKCDGTRAEARFRLSAKRTSPFKSAGVISSIDYWQPRCAHQR